VKITKAVILIALFENKKMKIEKKTWKRQFQDILDGKKNFDVRLYDFECKEGDTLVLREWDEDVGKYTGRTIEKVITYVSKVNDFKFWKKEEIDKYGLQVIGFK